MIHIDRIYMSSQIAINIGQSLTNQTNEIFNDDSISKKKSLEEYKENYRNTLELQLQSLIKERDCKRNEYKKVLDFHKKTIDKISYLHKKYSIRDKNVGRISNSTFTFLSLNLKNIKKSLDETIEQNISNSKIIYQLEQDLSINEYSINKTNNYILLNNLSN